MNCCALRPCLSTLIASAGEVSSAGCAIAAVCSWCVADDSGRICAYVLVILRRGTRLARLYSLAVDPDCKGQGLATRMLEQAESASRDAGALYLRLEVAADNEAAIGLYRKLGYLQFGLYRDYYEDHGDALRMEKCIHTFDPEGANRRIPWISQTTQFTCGPASLMMAMTALDSGYQPQPVEEIQIWREATTIFMTSGHGGCHPVGLALAARARGFTARVLVNQQGPLFVDGVRDPKKKRIMTLAHEAFMAQARKKAIPIDYVEVDQGMLCDSFARGANVLILISTYRFDNRKAPHWVVLSGYDEHCLYVHDPDLESDLHSNIADESRSALECQHLPIAKADFASMSRFGGNRLRAAVIIDKPE